MAFTGTSTIIQISDTCFRITGLSLANGATGKITFSGNPKPNPEIVIPSPNWDAYVFQGVEVNLADQVRCTVVPSLNAPISIAKNGLDLANFQILVSAGAATGALDIYIEKMI